MAKTVRDVMTRDPVSMSSETSVTEAAKAMSDLRIGSVIVMEADKPCGIVTDRDITVRAVATRSDPSKTRLADICSDDAMDMMKSHDVKRVLVMTDHKLEGIVSLGDLSRRGEGEDVQEDISRAEPNN